MTDETTARARVRLGTSKNGKEVWYDDKSSHAATHLHDTPGLKELVVEIIAARELTGDYLQFDTDMKRPVGTSDLVDTEPGDKIMYAKRLNRTEYTAFNMSKNPQPSSLVTTVLQAHHDATYELVSAWIGSCDSPAFPGSELETPNSKEYWSKHALAWGKQAIQPGSETEICPW